MENFMELSGGGMEHEKSMGHENSLVIGEGLDSSPARSVISLRGGPPVSPVAWICSSATLRVLASVVSWWSCSVLVIVLIKGIVQTGQTAGSFSLSTVTNATTGLLAWATAHIVRRKSGIHFPELEWGEFAIVILLGSIQGIEIACANKALEYLSISTRTMAGSLGVLFMMFSARAWGLEGLGVMRLVACALLTVGGVLQGFDHFSGDTTSENALFVKGISLQGGSLVASSQRWALIQWMTQRSRPGSALALMGKLKLELISRTLPCTGVVCFLFAFWFEPRALEIEPWLHMDMILKCAGIAVGIIVLVVAELEIVRTASAVALQVLGTLHQIPIAIAGILFFQEQIHLSSAMGFLFCIVGGLVYVQVRYTEMTVEQTSPSTGRATLAASLEGWPSDELHEHRLLQA